MTLDSVPGNPAVRGTCSCGRGDVFQMVGQGRVSSLGPPLEAHLKATKTGFSCIAVVGGFFSLLLRHGPSPPLLPGESCGLH